MQKRSFSPISNLVLALCLGHSLQASAASTPEKLASEFRAVIAKGDIDAALTLGDFKNTHPTLEWTYLYFVTSCVYDAICSVSVKPDDAASIAERTALQLNQGFEDGPKPEGLLVLTMVFKEPRASKIEHKIPFAKIAGQYRLVTGHYTAKKLTELHAQTDAQLLDAMFAAYPSNFRAGWKADATVLPAGGGEIGTAYAAKVANDYERYHAGDVDGVIAHGNPTVQRMFAPKERDGTPVAKSFRALQARADSVRMLVNIKILGGYQLGDYVVLEIQGTAENGWIERGPVILGRDSDGKFVRLFDRTISYPK